MGTRNSSITITYTAWDTAANEPKTGDGGNHTIKRIVDDAAAASITDSPTERENGQYVITLTGAENSGIAMTVEGASSTENVVIIPTKWLNNDLTVLPLQSSADGSGRLSPTYLTAYQYSKIEATLTILDADDAAIDLSGLTLAFVAWLKDTPGSTVITMRTDGDAELTIGGGDNNQVTIDGSTTHTATAAQYDWRLYDLDNSRTLADGTLNVEEGAEMPEI